MSANLQYQEATFGLWTFGRAADLVTVLHRIGFSGWALIEAFDGSRRKAKDLAPPRCAMAAALPIVDRSSGLLLGAEFLVSAFDECFPAVDWAMPLPRDSSRARQSTVSRIVPIFLRDIREYPSSIRIECSASQPMADRVWRELIDRLFSALDGMPDVGIACQLGTTAANMPPTSISPRMEQVSLLRHQVTQLYTAFSPPTKETPRKLIFPSVGIGEEDPKISELVADLWSERRYREEMEARGTFDTNNGALIFGRRSNHPLYAQVTAILDASDRVLLPLTNVALDLAMELEPRERPHLLTPNSSAAGLTSVIAECSREIASQRDRPSAIAAYAAALADPARFALPSVASAVERFFKLR